MGDAAKLDRGIVPKVFEGDLASAVAESVVHLSEPTAPHGTPDLHAPLPPTIPLVIMGLAMLAWLSNLGLSGTVTAVIISHTVLGAPFAMAVIRLRLSQMDPALEAAAWNLGASEWGAMRHVILPFCGPAIISALCLTAAVSFDEFAVAWFVSGLNKTVPVVILEILQGNVDPQINAIGTVVFLTSMTLVVLAQLALMTRNKEKTP